MRKVYEFYMNLGYSGYRKLESITKSGSYNLKIRFCENYTDNCVFAEDIGLMIHLLIFLECKQIY